MTSRESPPIFVLLLVAAAIVMVGLVLSERSKPRPEPRGGVRNVAVQLPERDIPAAAGKSEEAESEPEPEPTPEPTPTPEPEPEPSEPEPIELAMAADPGIVEGVVHSPQGQPVREATVALTFENLVEGGKKGPKLEAVTNRDGVFQIESVPPGSWSATAHHQEFAAGVAAGIEVESNEVTGGITLTLQTNTVLKGLVQTNRGLVLENAQVILTQRVLSVTGEDQRVLRKDIPYEDVFTGSDGTFRFDQAAVGFNALLVRMDGFAPERLELTLSRDQEREVTISLEPGASIGGLVRTVTGRPIQNAEVTLKDSLAPAFSSSTRTTADGRFRISGLRSSRTYKLTAKATNFAPAGPLEVPAGRLENIITLQSGGAITGVVRNYTTNQVESGIGLLLMSNEGTFPTEARTTTGQGGRYVFEHLPAGSYNVSISNDTMTSEPQLGINVKVGQTTPNVDFSIYPGMRITGIVADGNTGDRISMAQVKLASRVGPGFLQGIDSTTHTDSFGSFRFENLPYGLYTLESSAPGYLRFPGPEATASVRLMPRESVEPVTLLLSKGGTITGTVNNPAGDPIAGAEVGLYNAPGIPGSARVNTNAYRATSDASGSFSFDGIPLDEPRQLIASATAPGYAKGRSGVGLLTEYLTSASLVVQMTRGGVVQVSVRETGGMRLSDVDVSLSHNDFGGDSRPQSWDGKTNIMGQVTFENIPEGRVYVSANRSGYLGAGTWVTVGQDTPVHTTLQLERATRIVGWVVDDTGGPVIRGNVNARAESGARGGGGGSIDSRGRFVIEGVSPGRFTLDVNAQRDTPTGTHTIFRRVPNVVAGPAQEITIRVPMNGSIEGLVVDGNRNEPISGAHVQIQGRYSYQGNAMRNFSVGRAFSNPPGAFRFTSIPPGTYTVRVTAPNYLPVVIEDVNITSPGRQALGRIMLDQGGIIRARVLAEDTKEPVGGVTVRAVPDGNSARTNAQGIVTISGLEPGIYNLEASHGQFLPAKKNIIQVTRGEQTDAGDIMMDRGAVIYGQVTDGSGNPIESATISVRHTALDKSRVVRTDRAGNYRLTGLEAGGITVSATANFPRGPATKTERDQVSLMSEVRRDFTLAGNLRLEGIVRGPLGAMLVNPRIEVYPMEADDRPVTRGRIIASVSNGRFEIDDMIEGRYIVFGSGQWGSHFVRWHRIVYVSHPGTNAAIVAPNGSVTGRVTRQGGGGVAEKPVIVRALSFPHSNMNSLLNHWSFETKTDSNGNYSVMALPAGRYEVLVYDNNAQLHRSEIMLNTENGSVTRNVTIP